MKPMHMIAIGAGAFVAYRAWVAYQQTYGEAGAASADQSSGWMQGAGDILTGAAQSIDSMTGGFMKISAMAQVQGDALNSANVRAMLAVIRTGEGTTGAAGYQTLFGGAKFASLDDHPRILVKRSGLASTAAGAYQMLSSTWDETKRIMNLPDFGQASQDMAAIGRMAARGALADVLRGDFKTAIAKLGKEWASLPGSPYGQPVMTMAKATQVYLSNGGQVTA